MIIFGSRMYGSKNQVRGYGACENCGAYGGHRSYEARRFGHIYFIPLIPSGGPVRVMKECASCKMGRHMRLGQVRALYTRIESLMQPCVLAANEGRRTFEDPEHGEELHTGPFLLEAVDLLVTAGHGKELPGILDLLDNDAARYEHLMALGAWHEIRGAGREAVQAFVQACEVAPDQPLPWLIVADFDSRAGRHAEALASIERAEAMLPGDVQVMLSKAGPLEALGRYEELSAMLEHALTLAPGLERDKPFNKLRKKAAKKAAKAGGG